MTEMAIPPRADGVVMPSEWMREPGAMGPLKGRLYQAAFTANQMIRAI